MGKNWGAAGGRFGHAPSSSRSIGRPQGESLVVRLDALRGIIEPGLPGCYGRE